MPELPDIVVLTRSMNEVLPGQTIIDATINQPKVLNIPIEEFISGTAGREIIKAQQRGKWILISLDADKTLAINLGMGGQIRLRNPTDLPDPSKERVVFRMDNDHQIWIHFWWFGHVHLIDDDELHLHKQIGKLGIEPLSNDFTVQYLSELLSKRRGRIKGYLVNQHVIAGIGNVYVQDILWRAKLHPERKANTLSDDDFIRLHHAIQTTLNEGIKYGGGPNERDIWGNEGKYPKYYQVAYRTGKKCPECNTTIEKIRVGSSTSYICPNCQK